MLTALVFSAAAAGSLLMPAVHAGVGSPPTTSVVAQEKPANCGTANTPPCEA